jgi:rare lipoprotein A
MLRAILTTLAVMLFSIFYSQSTTGKASYYGKQHHGRKMASGGVFNMWSMTCASNKYPLGTRLKITNPENDKSVIVKVTDRGGFGKYGRILDLSKGAFAEIASVSKGVITVVVNKLTDDDLEIIPLKL